MRSLYTIFFLLTCFVLQAQSDVNKISINRGFSLPFQFETRGDLSTNQSSRLSYARYFKSNHPKLAFVAKTNLTFSGFKQDIDDQSFQTYISFIDFIGGLKYHVFERLSAEVELGPGILLQAKDKNSEISYLDSRIFQ